MRPLDIGSHQLGTSWIKASGGVAHRIVLGISRAVFLGPSLRVRGALLI